MDLVVRQDPAEKTPIDEETRSPLQAQAHAFGKLSFDHLSLRA